MDIPHWKCSKKLQRKKTITTIEIHYSANQQVFFSSKLSKHSSQQTLQNPDISVEGNAARTKTEKGGTRWGDLRDEGGAEVGVAREERRVELRFELLLEGPGLEM